MFRELLLALCASLLSASAIAQTGASATFPAKTIHIVVPFPAGGGANTVTRTLLAPLQEELGQPVVLRNMPGASGYIGMAHVARSAADGYTLVLGSNNMATNPHMLERHFLPLRDLVPVGRVAASPLLVVANPAVQANNLRELVELSKRSAQPLGFGSPGIGTPMHLAGELINRQTGAKLQHVPYQGTALGLNDVLAGHIPLLVTSASPVLEHIRSGRLKAIAVLADHRLAQLPQVLTAREAGINGVDVDVWYGYFAPVGTPALVLARLERAFGSVAQRGAVAQKYLELGLEPGFVSAAALAPAMKAEYEQWGELISSLP